MWTSSLAGFQPALDRDDGDRQCRNRRQRGSAPAPNTSGIAIAITRNPAIAAISSDAGYWAGVSSALRRESVVPNFFLNSALARS